MQSSCSLHWRHSAVCPHTCLQGFCGGFACFPSSSCASCSSVRLSTRFWQSFHRSGHDLLAKETLWKCNHLSCRLHGFQIKAVSETAGCKKFWSCLKSSSSIGASQRNKSNFHFRDVLITIFPVNSHGSSLNLFLPMSFLSPNGSLTLKTSIVLTVTSILLSNLLCCACLCLNGAPAFAHENEIFQKEVSSKPMVMKPFRMEVGSSERQGGAHFRDLVQPWSFHGEAAPLFALSDNAAVCKEAYGLLPCSDSLPGNLFLILFYGYLLLQAARLISEGSELLLEVMNPGVIGGLLLPVLGALPDAALVTASGIGGTVEEAQQAVLVGVGVLAGSTTLILTVTWAGSLLAGRCDLSGPGHTAKDLTLTRGFDLYNTGITTDQQTPWGASIMIASGAPYVLAQLPLLDKHPEQGPGSVLAGCILALSGLVLYCSYQIGSPWLQKKKIEEARLQFLRTSALQSINAFLANRMAPSEQGLAPSDSLLQEVFTSFDKNDDGKIEQNELRGLILGLNIEQGSFQDKEQVEKWFKEFDLNTDGMLSEAEFLMGIRNWATRVAEQGKFLKRKTFSGNASNFWGEKFDEAKQALNLLEEESVQGEEFPADGGNNFGIDTSKIYRNSVIYLVSGAALAAIFSDPLIDSIQGFSNASHTPPFFVAFIVVPLASNASELFSSIVFARKRRKRNISLAYSQIYGAVTMNNTLCLGIFLGIVYARGLMWDFSSEVTVVLLNILVVGLIGAWRCTFPLWFAIPVFSLYFISLGGVALLDNLLGWQ